MKKNPDAGTLALLILAGLGGWMLLRPKKKKKKDQPVVVQVAALAPAPVLSPEAQAVERVRSIHPPGWRGLRWFVGRVPIQPRARQRGAWYVGRRGISPAGTWDDQLWLVGDDGTMRLTTRPGPIFDDLKEYLG
jgi:hypothetical protein